jgi:hypothetical protein
MPERARHDGIRGTTLRWTFSEGPQAGKTYEHTFHDDGTVTYRPVEDNPVTSASNQQPRSADAGGERPPYAVYPISENVRLVSYRADSGFTLTVALNVATHELVSIASNSEQWFPARGTFEVAGAATPEAS